MAIQSILLNADVGEGLPTDEQLYPLLDQASIACGGHAGDGTSMREAVLACLSHNVTIGAHPSYPDKANFGRVSMNLTNDELKRTICSQIDALRGICLKHGATLRYVKPHGALYNDLARDKSLFAVVLEAISEAKASSETDVALSLMIGARPDLSEYQAMARQHGVMLLKEAFADRQYLDDGRLSPRSNPNAVYSTEAPIVHQCARLIRHREVITDRGTALKVDADSLCLHGDNPASVAAAKPIRALLNATE